MSGMNRSHEHLTKWPLKLDNSLLVKAITFQTCVNRKLLKTKQKLFNSNHNPVMNSELAVAFLAAFLSSTYARRGTIKINFITNHSPLCAKPIIAVLDYINRMQIDCLPIIYIDTSISHELLDKVIEYKCLFHISYPLSKQDFIRIRNNQLIERPVLDIFNKIRKGNLPFIYCPVVTQQNVTDMTSMVQFGYQQGACGIIFKMNDHLLNSIEDDVRRPNVDLYRQYLAESLKLAETYGLEIVLSERVQLLSRGNFQLLPTLVLLPDGYITTTKTYHSSQEKGAQKAIIGHFSAQEGIKLFQDKINKMNDNIQKNLASHCKNCTCFEYCRGRNTNMKSFKESIIHYKDDYRCKITQDTFKLLEDLKND